MSVTLHGIGYSAGTPVPITEMPNSEEERELLSFFSDDGFLNFVRSAENIGEMIVQAISYTFTRTPLQRREIDGIIVCTESFWDKDLAAGRQTLPDCYRLREGLLQAVFGRCGLINAHPYGNWLSSCANFVSTLALAQALVTSGQHSNVAVVIADRLAPQLSRIMLSRASILSDMAGCFLIGRLRCGYEIRHVIKHVATSAYLAHESNDVQRRVLNTLQELKVFAEKAYRITGRKIGDFEKVAVDCLNSTWIELMSQGLGVDPRRLATSQKAEYAHAFAIDNLLALTRLEESGELKTGEEVALLNLGPWTYGLVVLEVL